MAGMPQVIDTENLHLASLDLLFIISQVPK